MKRLIKKFLDRTAYREVRRGQEGRFSAIQSTLESLRDRGYAPRRIRDGGANVGEFARLAEKVFWPERLHLFEPQPVCVPILRELATNPRFRLHPVALGSEPATLTLATAGDEVTTGAHIIPEAGFGEHSNNARVPVETLDDAIGPELCPADRALLKLDLQGWELEALKGATACLEHIEVILTEVSFYAQAYEPPIEELISFLHSRGYRLQDIATLTARHRDNRAHQGDFVFIRHDSPLTADNGWA